QRFPESAGVKREIRERATRKTAREGHPVDVQNSRGWSIGQGGGVGVTIAARDDRDFVAVGAEMAHQVFEELAGGRGIGPEELVDEEDLHRPAPTVWRLSRYHDMVSARPLRSEVEARKPNSRSARDVSRQRRGWPLGFELSQ